jgi:hypothetical protein
MKEETPFLFSQKFILTYKKGKMKNNAKLLNEIAQN